MSEPSTSKAVPPATHLGRVGGFELLLELASGGMATVYLARAVDGRTGVPIVALKRPHRHLATDKVFLSMLIDEARLASVISHPNVVRVRELGFEAGEPFVVMDYVEGSALSDLRKVLSPHGRALDTSVAVRIVLDALAGLHAAHGTRDENGKHLGIIHRDVSPHNVIVGMDGVARITDFGIAKAEDRVQTTRTHEVKGKLAYLAPERVDKRRTCTVQSDLFSMGVVLWECIAGRRLFRGEEAIDTLQEVLQAPIPRLRQLGANVPEELDDVIARALSRSLETRHQTAAELAQAIERAVGASHIGTAADVAKVMEGIFGQRMAMRDDMLRQAAPHVDMDALLELSKLPHRERLQGGTDVILEAQLSALTPPAPSARYTFGVVSMPASEPTPRPARRWRVPLAVGVGVFIGGAAAFAMVSQVQEPARVVVVNKAEPETEATPASSSVPRRVVVPLPFRVVRATLDDQEKVIDPATDVVAFEVPKTSGTRHRLVAISADGTRAEGYVTEADGVAAADSAGLSISHPLPEAPRPVTGFKPRPVGTTRNGFTKLK